MLFDLACLTKQHNGIAVSNKAILLDVHVCGPTSGDPHADRQR